VDSRQPRFRQNFLVRGNIRDHSLPTFNFFPIRMPVVGLFRKQDKNSTFLVMELACGGTWKINCSTSAISLKKLPSTSSSKYFRQLSIVTPAQPIAYRDLNPANVLLTDSSEFAGVKISLLHLWLISFFLGGGKSNWEGLLTNCNFFADPRRLSWCWRSLVRFVAMICFISDADYRLWSLEAHVMSLVANNLLRNRVVHCPGSETPTGWRGRRFVHAGSGRLEYGSHLALHAVWEASRVLSW
jgi:serine/threonine protein kinase